MFFTILHAVSTCTHTCTRTHTHIHAHTHTHTHTHAHTRTRTHIHTRTHTRTHMQDLSHCHTPSLSTGQWGGGYYFSFNLMRFRTPHTLFSALVTMRGSGLSLLFLWKKVAKCTLHRLCTQQVRSNAKEPQLCI